MVNLFFTKKEKNHNVQNKNCKSQATVENLI